MGYPFGGGVGTMGGSKGVIDVDVDPFGKLFREPGIVLLLARVQAKILQKKHLPRLESRNCGPTHLTDAIGREKYPVVLDLRTPQGRTILGGFYGFTSPFRYLLEFR